MKLNSSYDPKCSKYPYPLKTDHHYLEVKKNNGLVFDEDYPYIDKSSSFTRLRKLFYCIIFCIVFPMTRIKMGLRIYGKKNLRKNKKLLSKGAISVSNHVHLWDYLCVMRGIMPRRPNVLVWAPNIRGENSFLLRMVGGIPIPEEDYKATMTYFNQVERYLHKGGWLHIYAEGSMWEYYRPIRPMKTGAASFAIKVDRPIVPMAFSYRKPSWIRRKLFHQIALFNLNIGKPILPDGRTKEELTEMVHQEVCRLAGINDNIYPPIFHNDDRIDYYTDVYGDKN